MISKGNRKLDKSIGIFNLPSGMTCPGAGKCREICYAKKAERMYPGCLPCRMRNFNETRDDDFAKDMISQIKRAKVKVFRIHESGDFYDQVYLDKWIEVAKEMGDVKFYAYTKSLHLDFRRVPPNLVIVKSFGGKYDWMIDKRKDNHAIILFKGDKHPKGYHNCPGKGCGSVCNYCFGNGHIKVAFHKH